MMRYSLSQYEDRGEDWKTFRIAALLCVVAFLSISIVEQAWSAQPPGQGLNITEVAVIVDDDNNPSNIIIMELS